MCSEKNTFMITGASLKGLAVHWSLKKCRNFLWRDLFVVKPVHKPLCEIFMKRGLDSVSSRICRWFIDLQKCLLTVEYIQGACNKCS